MQRAVASLRHAVTDGYFLSFLRCALLLASLDIRLDRFLHSRSAPSVASLHQGGYFYAGVLRLVFVHHATFCVNSLAHWLGEATYTDRLSPRNHVLTALVTMGEGYHNFHHEFPHDFRNGIEWYHYDPTKWLIAGANMLGLTYGLKQMPHNEIMKGVLGMKEKKIRREMENLDYGRPREELPSWTWDECG